MLPVSGYTVAVQSIPHCSFPQSHCHLGTTHMKHIVFVFVDGVGLGPDTSSNPLANFEGTAFRRLAGQKWHQSFRGVQSEMHVARPIDATLGVDGLPQSGTGQASLFTGMNCAQLVGRHFGPFPHSQTHTALNQSNLFQRLQALPSLAKPAAFANAFPPQYLNAERRRSTVTTYCCQSADVELRDLTALQNGRALSADLTRNSWREELELDVAQTSPWDAADILLSIARNHWVTLFEYFRTDKLGHARIDVPPKAVLEDLDQLFSGLLDDLDPTRDTLLITSDHGNLEDISHTQHTRNPVPLIVYGWAAPFFADATTLTDVTPALIEAVRASCSASNDTV